MLCSVCGGDGTVGWVLSEMDRVDWQAGRPPLAIIPLGQLLPRYSLQGLSHEIHCWPIRFKGTGT